MDDTPTLAGRLRRLASELTAVADRAVAADGRFDAGPRGRRPSSDDHTQRSVLVVDRFLEAVEGGALELLDDVVTPDVVYLVPGRSRAAGLFEGPGAMRQAMAVRPRAGVRHLRSSRTDVVADGDRVVTFHELAGSVDGGRRTVELALRFELREGRIARIVELNGDQHVTDDLFA